MGLRQIELGRLYDLLATYSVSHEWMEQFDVFQEVSGLFSSVIRLTLLDA